MNIQIVALIGMTFWAMCLCFQLVAAPTPTVTPTTVRVLLAGDETQVGRVDTATVGAGHTADAGQRVVADMVDVQLPRTRAIVVDHVGKHMSQVDVERLHYVRPVAVVEATQPRPTLIWGATLDVSPENAFVVAIAEGREIGLVGAPPFPTGVAHSACDNFTTAFVSGAGECIHRARHVPILPQFREMEARI